MLAVPIEAGEVGGAACFTSPCGGLLDALDFLHATESTYQGSEYRNNCIMHDDLPMVAGSNEPRTFLVLLRGIGCFDDEFDARHDGERSGGMCEMLKLMRVAPYIYESRL